MKKILLTLAASAALLVTGCTTTSTTSATGTVTTTKTIDWPVLEQASGDAAQLATVAVLSNKSNAKYASEVSAVNAAIQASFVGTPTSASIAAAIQQAAPDWPSTLVNGIAVVVADAANLYLKESGNTQILATDSVAAGFVTAITTGIADGAATVQATSGTSTTTSTTGS